VHARKCGSGRRLARCQRRQGVARLHRRAILKSPRGHQRFSVKGPVLELIEDEDGRVVPSRLPASTSIFQEIGASGQCSKLGGASVLVHGDTRRPGNTSESPNMCMASLGAAGIGRGHDDNNRTKLRAHGLCGCTSAVRLNFNPLRLLHPRASTAEVLSSSPGPVHRLPARARSSLLQAAAPVPRRSLRSKRNQHPPSGARSVPAFVLRSTRLPVDRKRAAK
jgi:hypothetical protein